MTAFKLINYYLQAIETEVSVRKLQQVQDLLKDYQSCMILYTYDSILIDLELSEIKIIPQLQYLLEKGKFPIKMKYGVTYDNMQEIKK
jgi:hypothetical protein